MPLEKKFLKNTPVKVRTLNKGRLSIDNLPEPASLLVEYYTQFCEQRGLDTINFNTAALPLSLNNDKYHGRNKKTGRFFKSTKPAQSAFYQMVNYALVSKKHQWKPTGATAAIIFFESKNWATLKHTIRKQDVDNKVKPTFDAIEKATGIGDERHWHFHTFKVQSKYNRTWVWLFDLGDIIEVY